MHCTGNAGSASEFKFFASRVLNLWRKVWWISGVFAPFRGWAFPGSAVNISLIHQTLHKYNLWLFLCWRTLYKSETLHSEHMHGFFFPLKLNMILRLLFTRIFLFSFPSSSSHNLLLQQNKPQNRRDSRDTSPSDMDPSRRPRYRPKTGSRLIWTTLTLTPSPLSSWVMQRIDRLASHSLVIVRGLVQIRQDI